MSAGGNSGEGNLEGICRRIADGLLDSPATKGIVSGGLYVSTVVSAMNEEYVLGGIALGAAYLIGRSAYNSERRD